MQIYSAVQLGLKPEQMRAMLGRFGLSGHHHLQPILKLSGGQKARVVFTAIALGEPHILLLDEPTNHLDMQSIDALAEALEEVITWLCAFVQRGIAGFTAAQPGLASSPARPCRLPGLGPISHQPPGHAVH